MSVEIKLVVQCHDSKSGELLEEEVILNDELNKAMTLKELGYLHSEQIAILEKVQNFKIKHQMALQPPLICPKCGKKARKSGMYTGIFHAALTDHRIPVQRMLCPCGWISGSSIEGIYGSSMHPDLLAKQAIQGSKESYAKASKNLDAESAKKRAINSHSQIYKSVKCVAQTLEQIRCSDNYGQKAEPAEELTVNIDGGHIKARGDNRSFEAMVATVHRHENLTNVNKSHNKITSKTAVASAKDDHQGTIKKLIKSACRAQGMTELTIVTCLADGAENCWSIAHSIESDCKKITYILDWFHIGMKFKNISIPPEHTKLYEKVKWHLWHGKPKTSLIRLNQLQALIEEESTLTKLKKLETYITNNEHGIINYGSRKRMGLCYTSQLAESTVNSLINDRQKGKQKMLWSREGAHNILQIRSSSLSHTWKSDWQKVERELYQVAA